MLLEDQGIWSEGTGYEVVRCDTCQNCQARRRWSGHRKVLSDDVRSKWNSESFKRGPHFVLKITLTKLTCWYRSCYSDRRTLYNKFQ